MNQFAGCNDNSKEQRLTVQDLSKFKMPHDYDSNRPRIRWLLWFCFGAPLIQSGIPGSRWRRLLLRCYGASVGRKVVIKPHVIIKFPWRLEVGENSWIGEKCWIDNLEWVRIGANVCLSQGSYLCTGNHDYRQPSFPYRLGKITVHSEAWVCAMARIAPGVTIGEGAVLGLGSVAVHNLDPFTRYQGNPAKAMGARTPALRGPIQNHDPIKQKP